MYNSRLLLTTLILSSALWPSVASAKTDLSGSWVIPGKKGHVLLRNRRVGAKDRYSAYLLLKDAERVQANALFDGRELILVKKHRPPSERTETHGIVGALEGEHRPSSAPSTDPETTVIGRYQLTSRTSKSFRGQKQVRFLWFKATGSAPVQSFVRMRLKLTIKGPKQLSLRGPTILEASVSPALQGQYRWYTSSKKVTLETKNNVCLVKSNGENTEKVDLRCQFLPKTLRLRHETTHSMSPAKAIRSISISAMTYHSDHGLLKDYKAGWSNLGKPFAEPEWTPSRQHPISHSMGKAMKLTLKLEVQPKDLGEQQLTLHGLASDHLRFEKTVTVKGGENLIEIDSGATRLPYKVRKMNFGIVWTMKSAGQNIPTSPRKVSNTMFLTVGTPSTPARRPGITLKRMEKAMEAVSPATDPDPHALVKNVIQKWGRFNLEVAYRNAWELGDDQRDASGRLIGADCQTIVRYSQNVTSMIGCPGKSEFVVVWANCTKPTKAIVSIDAKNHMTNPLQFHNAHFSPSSKKADWIAVLVDGNGGLNNYEAALRFTYRNKANYYPGGVRAVFTKPKQVLHVFQTMSWVAAHPNTGRYQQVGTIHRY